MSGLLLTRRKALLGAAVIAAPAIIKARTADACTCASGGTGPGVTGTFINADFTSLTGATVARELFGGASATMMDNNWTLCGDSSFIAQSKLINPPLIRLNCNSGASTPTWQTVFGAPPSGTPNFTGPNVFIANANQMFNLPTTRIIVGIGGVSTTGTTGDTLGQTPTQFANMCTQIVNHFLTTPGSDGNVVTPYGYEIFNEWDGRFTPANYAAYFNPAAAAIIAAQPSAKMYGPTTANNGTDMAGFLANTNGTNFAGSLDDHAYLKCPGDPVPSDAQMVQALNGGSGTLPNGWAANASTIAAGQAYSTNYRLFNGEYNVDCAGGDSRQQDWRGGVFVSSWVNKLVDGAAHNNIVEAGIWDYGGGDGSYGQFVGSPGNWTPSPQASFLSQGAKVVPGLRCNVTLPGAGGMLAWPTVNGTHFSLTIVNPGTAVSGQQVALSHWPLNSSGTGNISVWTQSQASPNGTISSLAVTGGLTAGLTIPTLGQVILFA